MITYGLSLEKQNTSLYLTLGQAIIIFQFTHSRAKTRFFFHMGNSNGMSSFWCTDSPKHFLNLLFQLFLKFLQSLVFWMDDILIYSQTEEEHLKHVHLVFEKFQEAPSTSYDQFDQLL